jgi:hypothetical protein
MMTSAKRIVFLLFLLAALAAVPAGAASAAPAPVWRLTAALQPTNLVAGEANDGSYPLYSFTVTNIGGAPGTFTLAATLPAGITPTALGANCSFAEPVLTCTGGAGSGQNRGFLIPVEAGAPLSEGSIAVTEATVSGSGAPEVGTSVTTQIASALPAFGFLGGANGLSAVLGGLDGSPATAAGSHPPQLTADLGFPSQRLGTAGEITGVGGGVRDLIGHGPAGLLGNPAATPVRCQEALLEARECPIASAVGIATVLTPATPGSPLPSESPLFNMVTPAGTPAELGFDAAGVGIFVHVKASVRTDGDYGVDLTTNDALSRSPNPVLGAQLQLWGDPSDPLHERVRGACNEEVGPELCPVAPQEAAFLTLPTSCSPGPLQIGASADDWVDPATVVSASAPITDPAGAPTSVDGCNALSFEPTLTAQPTTDLADSPSGLDVDLHQPQDQKLAHLSPAALKDAAVTLPEGMAANPSQADGLAACTPAQIGMATAVGEVPPHFDKQPNTCPDAAKLGTVEVTSPLLAEYKNEGTEARTDPVTGEPIPRPLEGSVYLAQQGKNPFGSLLAVYLAVEDPQSGTVAKLAGQVVPDPQTGQLTTVFTENPELPLEDVRLHLFGGARGALITPPTCGPHATTSDLVPWSAPEGQDAHPTDTFLTAAEPGGGACPASPGQMPNQPSFSAGTLSPQAGAYSPFVLKLSREDGSQRLAGFDTVLPPGLTGRLAGIPACSDAEIAKAESRSGLEEGALEQADPSCPASSQLGTVDVAAGAGPAPFHATGTAYLAGPYKGAPLSMAVITPAVAGPFDLGTVVVRAALHVEPETTQIHAVSDPFPQILHGIPLDLRSVAVSLGRPQFTLNPTSCEEMQITGSAVTAQGQAAPLQSRFQVGGCQALPFAPKLSLALKGKVSRTAHPRLLATLTARPGEANIARARVKLPKAAFLDQGHIKTICTRVQFAADACPPGSVYGKAEATTPLLGYPLSGPVYLRSSSHTLPDLVVKLKGPASQPIEIDLDGRTDSVKGALRNSFEAVPDQPVTRFHLELFGGKRGLIEMSSGFCSAPRAAVDLTGQNGKLHDTTPVVGGKCPKHKKKHRPHKRHAGHRHGSGR